MQIIHYSIKFFLYIVLHLFLFSNISFTYAFSFGYVGFLLILPFKLSTISKMLIGFILGICIDIFYDTLGIHAFACVAIMYFRPYIERLAADRRDDMINKEPTLQQMKFNWFFSYAIILLFIHHFIVLFLEAGFNIYFYKLLFTAVLSALISFAVIYITERGSSRLFKI